MAGFMAGGVARFAEVPAVSAYRLTLCHTTAGYKLAFIAMMSDPSAKNRDPSWPDKYPGKTDKPVLRKRTPGSSNHFCLSPAFPFHFVETNSPSFHIDHRRGEIHDLRPSAHHECGTHAKAPHALSHPLSGLRLPDDANLHVLGIRSRRRLV